MWGSGGQSPCLLHGAQPCGAGTTVGTVLGMSGQWGVVQGGSRPRCVDWGSLAVPLAGSALGCLCECGQVAEASGTSFSFPPQKGDNLTPA